MQQEDFLLKLRAAYAEISKGYTATSFKDSPVYLKHYTEPDILELDLLHQKYFEEAKSKGLFTLKEKLDQVYESGEWSKEEEAKYHSLQKKLLEWERGLADVMLKSQKEKIEKDIEKIRKEFSEIDEERNSILGKTCESHTEKQKNEYILLNTFFKDKELKELLFTDEEFYDLEPVDYYSLILTQSICFDKFTDDKLDQIAAYPFFLTTFMACENSVLIFYGKPLVELTLFQMNLFSKGRHYKSILEHGKTPPETLYKNPEQLVSWYNNAAKQGSKGGGGGGGSQPASNVAEIGEGKASIKAGAIVGEEKGAVAREKQLSQSNLDEQVVSLTDEAGKMMKETGKDKLNIMDLAKIHGLLD